MRPIRSDGGGRTAREAIREPIPRRPGDRARSLPPDDSSQESFGLTLWTWQVSWDVETAGWVLGRSPE